MKVKFLWFDLWVGVYIDCKNRKIFVCPIPMLVFIFRIPDNVFRRL